MRKLLLVGVFVCMLLVVSCTRPPRDVVVVEIEGKPVAAWDINQDGAPDIDAAGNIAVVPGSEKYIGAGDTADSIAPTILQTLGGIIGIPLLVGLGAAWKKHKYGRILANTIMSVQSARARLKEGGLNDALDVVDETLGSTQTKETTNIIRETKKSLGIRPVT